MKILLLLICLHHIAAQQFTTNLIGKLHVSDRHWNLEYTLNLTEYFRTISSLNGCVKTLRDICRGLDNPLCEYFIVNTENIITDVNTDITRFRAFSREKRSTESLFFGLTPMSLLFGLPSFLSLEKLRTGLIANSENLKNVSHLTHIASERLIYLENFTNSTFESVQIRLQNLSDQAISDRTFFSMIHLITASAMNHEKIQQKLNIIYSNSLESRLFEVIDFLNFTSTLKAIDLKLNNFGSTVPDAYTRGANKFLKVDTTFDDSSLTIRIRIPIFQKRYLQLEEFIPLPTLHHDTVTLLDLECQFIIRNESGAYTLDKSILDKHCVSQNERIICNSFLDTYTFKPSPCISGLLIIGNNPSNSQLRCIFKPIDRKNYFIRTSETSLFAFIVDQISIRVQCKSNEYIRTLNQSVWIALDGTCEIYKVLKSSVPKVTFSVLGDLKKLATPQIGTNTSRFQSTFLPLAVMDKMEIHNLDLLNLSDSIDTKISEDIRQIKNISDDSSGTTSESSFFSFGNPFSFDLWGLLKNKIIEFGLTILGLLIAALMFKCLIIYLLKKIFSCNGCSPNRPTAN